MRLGEPIMTITMKTESEVLNELELVNKNISVYAGMLKIEMAERKREEIREEIYYLETEIIPQLRLYDV